MGRHQYCYDEHCNRNSLTNFDGSFYTFTHERAHTNSITHIHTTHQILNKTLTLTLTKHQILSIDLDGEVRSDFLNVRSTYLTPTLFLKWVVLWSDTMPMFSKKQLFIAVIAK